MSKLIKELRDWCIGGGCKPSDEFETCVFCRAAAKIERLEKKIDRFPDDDAVVDGLITERNTLRDALQDIIRLGDKPNTEAYRQEYVAAHSRARALLEGTDEC